MLKRCSFHLALEHDLVELFLTALHGLLGPLLQCENAAFKLADILLESFSRFKPGQLKLVVKFGLHLLLRMGQLLPSIPLLIPYSLLAILNLLHQSVFVLAQPQDSRPLQGLSLRQLGSHDFHCFP